MHKQNIRFAELPEDHYLQPTSEEAEIAEPSEEAAVCDTCSGVMPDIYKAVFLRETAKIEFEPTDKDHALTSADFDRVCEASDHARCVAQIGLESYQDGMRRMTEQND